jgi:hypothetical protein
MSKLFTANKLAQNLGMEFVTSNAAQHALSIGKMENIYKNQQVQNFSVYRVITT